MSDPDPGTSEKAPSPLTVADLRRIVTPGNVEPGFAIFDGKLVVNPARSGLRLYAEVKGSGKVPYRVTVDFTEGKAEVEGVKCNCPAARFQGHAVCKHAAAVLVAWMNAPTSFAVLAEPRPETMAAGAGGKKKSGPRVKVGTADTAEQAGKGLASLETLLAELANSGLATLTAQRAQQVREISQNLRPYKLRRLAPACMRFASTLEAGAANEAGFSAERYAQELAALTFHVRGLRRLIGRTDTDAEDYKRLADELLGRTWTARHLTEAPEMRLLDLNYSSWTTEDGFVVEQSLLADVATGEVFCDKAIKPAALSKRQPPKEDFGRRVVDAKGALVYPGYTPRRIKIGEADKRAATGEEIAPLLASMPQSVADLHGAFQAYAADVFAPLPMVALLRTQKLVAARGEVFAADSAGRGVRLDLTSPGVDALESALERAPLQAVLGHVQVNGGALTLAPLSLVTGTVRAISVVDMPRAVA
jgi:hypothetical protein